MHDETPRQRHTMWQARTARSLAELALLTAVASLVISLLNYFGR
jgi:hypothetical protein